MGSMRYLKKYSLAIGIAIAFLCAETYADLMQPLLLSKLVDVGLKSNQYSVVFHYGLLMLLATLFGLIGALMRNQISSHVSYAYARDLREALFKKLMKLQISEVDELESGSLVTRLTVDVNMVQQFINGLMRIFLKAPLLAIGSFFMVRQLDPRFLKVYFCLIPIVILITLIQLKIGYPLYARIQRVLDRINQLTMEFLGGIRTVRAFNRFTSEKNVFNDISHDLAEVTTKTMRIMSVFAPLIMLTINFGVVYAIYFGRDWFFVYGVGVGQLIAFSNYMTQFYFAMSIISRVFTVFVRAKASKQRIDEIFLQKGIDSDLVKASVHSAPIDSSVSSATFASTVHSNTSFSKETTQYALELNHVFYRYGDGIHTLKDISFRLEAGKRLGIIGATGSGKSTLIQVIQNILTDTNGSVSLFGQNIHELTKEDISHLIAYVPQKVTLFTGTVVENLAWGKRDISDEHYIHALRTAEAFDFVDQMPLKLHSPIGRNGIQLSGGQKQRLSIARAIVSNPRILILDDVTSAVDVITERKIKKNLKDPFPMNETNSSTSTSSIAGGLTTIIVAQKISTVMDLDMILILDEGQIIGMGTHFELIKNSSYYNDLYAAEMGVTYESTNV